MGICIIGMNHKLTGLGDKMAHHAKIEDGIVTSVIVTMDSDEDTFADRMLAETGEQYVRTSYNAATNGFRFNFAGIGYHWDGTGFYAPQPYPSWTLNETTCLWEAPVAMPEEGQYIWNESITNWTEVV